MVDKWIEWRIFAYNRYSFEFRAEFLVYVQQVEFAEIPSGCECSEQSERKENSMENWVTNFLCMWIIIKVMFLVSFYYYFYHVCCSFVLAFNICWQFSLFFLSHSATLCFVVVVVVVVFVFFFCFHLQCLPMWR